MSGTRRQFLRSGMALGAAVAASPFDALRQRCQVQASETRSVGYGPLRPTPDETTGLELIKLPEGFRYVTFGWTGDELACGKPTPSFHDGMAAIRQEGNLITLIRNHEVNRPAPSIAAADATYDPQAGGGCTRLVFDTERRALVSASAVLGGTHKNCAGGPTPWGTWLSCEETIDDAGGVSEKGEPLPFEQDHGYIFEVPADGTASAKPLRDMGRFVHEAIAIDPASGIVYETEDQAQAGFYRFLPKTPGTLADGGRLQMMKLTGRPDVQRQVSPNAIFDVEWVDIEDPLRPHSPLGPDGLGVYAQGKMQGATTFSRLEGCWFGGGKVYIASTSGGDAGLGQIWEYNPRTEQMRLLFESPDSHVLDYPDNITVSPRGALVLCEDGKHRAERLCGLTLDGQIFPLAENHVVLHGEKQPFEGDFTEEEWCGATFSPDGRWLFANIQKPGLTVAITGPWEAGPL